MGTFRSEGFSPASKSLRGHVDRVGAVIESEFRVSLRQPKRPCLPYRLISISDFALQPGFCQIPITDDRERRNLEDGRSLFNTQAAEKAQFYDLAFAEIEFGKTFHRIVQSHNVRTPFRYDHHALLQRNRPDSCSAFLRCAGSSVVHEYPPHELRRYSVKMRPVFPTGILPVGEPQVGFVKKGARFQR